MIPSARLSAAIHILGDISAKRRPAADCLRDWGQGHRFAGSGDRAAIASLVYDALRVQSSSAWIMGSDTPRAILLGALKRMRGMDVEAIAALCTGEGFAPEALSETEREALTRSSLLEAPMHVQGDFPEWLSASLQQVFGSELAVEMAAMASRAPVDLRVNSLKALRPKLIDMLAHLGVETAPLAPFGLRIKPAVDGKAPAIQTEPAFLKGLIEIQDEGSQMVAALSGAKPGEQVLDLCAGGGGKTLALAAMMNNKGQLYAADSDKRRLAPIHERIERAGVRNVQVRTPRGNVMTLDDLFGRMDLVLIDAPCTGTGTWRRNPDAKWRIRPGSLDERLKEQAEILEKAPLYLKPGGRLVYITCSVLQEENDDQIGKLLSRDNELSAADLGPLAAPAGLVENNCRKTRFGLLLTPKRTGTDGFYVSMLRRAA